MIGRKCRNRFRHAIVAYIGSGLANLCDPASAAKKIDRDIGRAFPQDKSAYLTRFYNTRQQFSSSMFAFLYAHSRISHQPRSGNCTREAHASNAQPITTQHLTITYSVTRAAPKHVQLLQIRSFRSSANNSKMHFSTSKMHLRAPNLLSSAACQAQILEISYQPTDFIAHTVHLQRRGLPPKLAILKVGRDK